MATLNHGINLVSLVFVLFGLLAFVLKVISRVWSRSTWWCSSYHFQVVLVVPYISRKVSIQAQFLL